MKNNESKPAKVALYCRVAHMDESSIDSQKQKLCAFAETQGFDNFEFYIDNGESGLDFKRPAFFRLEADIQAGKIGKVISLDISRIGRDTIGVRLRRNEYADKLLQECGYSSALR
jgi:DNA invertase Pin-like site-specific DNA recombinase